MSKAVKKVASIALPVLGTVIFPGIGTAIGAAVGATGAAASAIGGAALGGIGGAIGGGGVKGALKGAALGGVGGYVAGGGLNNVLGTAAGTPIQGAVQPGAAALGNSAGSGILGSLGSAGKALQDLGVGAAAGIGGEVGAGSSILSSLSKVAPLANSAYGAYATDKAAAAQLAGQRDALQAQQDALTQVRGDLAPFRDAGTSTVGGLTTLVNDPNAQKDFITANPFYQSLAKDATDKLYANQAAKGKLGSGGTAQALQNSLLLLGNSLLNDDVTRKQNLVATGANAASGNATATQNTANNISSLNLVGGDLNANAATAKYGANKNLLRSILTL
jgi:hypothetical protein